MQESTRRSSKKTISPAFGGRAAGEDLLRVREIFRFFDAKIKKKGSLSPEEQVKFERAKQALAEAVGRQGREPQGDAVVPGYSSVRDPDAPSPAPAGAATASDEEVHAAAMAGDARQRLGDVRSGSMHALEAYRFYDAKIKEKGSLSPEEQVKFERAKAALAEAVGRQGREPQGDAGVAGGGSVRKPDAPSPARADAAVASDEEVLRFVASSPAAATIAVRGRKRGISGQGGGYPSLLEEASQRFNPSIDALAARSITDEADPDLLPADLRLEI